MPRLNLDIFGGNPTELTPEPTPERDTVPKAPPVARGAQEQDPKPSVRFIPVGFHEKHLRLLDDAVLSLRRQGEWGASKSAIIRALIDRHAEELEDSWLATKQI